MSEILNVSVYIDPLTVIYPGEIKYDDDLLRMVVNQLYECPDYYYEKLENQGVNKDTRDMFFDTFLAELVNESTDYEKNGYGDIMDFFSLEKDDIKFNCVDDTNDLEYEFPVEIDFDAMKEWLKDNDLIEDQTYYAYDIDYAYDDDEIDEAIFNLDNDEIETIFGFDATEYDDGNELLEEIKNRLYHEPALYDTLFDTQTKLEIPEEVWLQAVYDGDMEVITNYISDTTGFLVNDYKVDEELQDKINESREEQERTL